MEKEKVSIKFELPNRVVQVKPIKGRSSWLPEISAASFLFNDAHKDYVVPIKEKTGELVDPLTAEEREFFEDKDRSGMAFDRGDLSVHKKENNFWKSYIIRLDSTILKLDLSKPEDYIRYKVLLTNKNEICPNHTDKDRKWSYKYYITDLDSELSEQALRIDKTKEAYKAYGRLSVSVSEMIDFLKLYKLHNVKFNKVIPETAKENFLKVELEKILETDMETFLEVATDSRYEEKKLLARALEVEAVLRNELAYETPEGVFLGDTADEALNFLSNKRNNEVRLKILGRIENAAKK
jgi:hypothetical protein